MYNVSDATKIKTAYQDALYNENRKLKLSMKLNGKEVALENVLDSISWEWDGFSSSGYTVGQIIYSKVNFSLYKDVIVRELMDVEFTISIVIILDGVEQWLDIPFGKYKVAEVEQTKLQSRVTCYDKFYNSMQFVYVPLRSDRQYTSTEICDEIATQLGITIENVPTFPLANEDITIQNEDGTTTTQTGVNFDGWTYAEILGLVAGACGGNFFFNRDGNLVFQKGFYTSDVSLTESQFTEPTLKPITYNKTGIKITKRNDIEPIVVGDILADNSPRLLALSNPLFTTSSAYSLLTTIKTISYQPIATSIIGIMPLHLEPLDTISISYESITYTIPVFKLQYKFAGGLSGAIESYVSTDTETQSSVGGGLNSKINAVSNDVSSMQLLVANTINAGEINASSINALNIKAEKIETDVASINTLLAGNITTDNVHSMNITSEKFTVANGFITNAMINNVNASKINAGNINTSNVTISSKTGNLKIADNTLQIKDSTHVRVQIGKDATGDYNLYLWDVNGKLMWSATGLTEDAIKTQVIRNDMVKDNANINAGKLNIESLFTVLNEDESNTLKASKILLDTENQTLEVAFDSMKTSQSDLEETTQTLTTQLNVQQGSIETLVKDTEIIKGEQTTLKDNYSQIEQDVDSINLTVAQVQSDVNGKVSQDSVISSINLSTEGIAISGDKVELTGDTIVISNGVSKTLEDYLQTEDLTQEEIVTILNGSGDGLYLIDNKLLINAEYIQTGTVRADLVKVQLDEVSNLLPFNYVTMKNAINTDGFYINEDDNGLPFADCELPIYSGGGGNEFVTKPFGYSNITIESGKHYWFTCEYYAVWGNDTKPKDGVGTSTAISSGDSKYGTKTGNNLDIFLSDGTFGDIADNKNYFLLASVKDFNASVNIVERENYEGVYQRGWTRLVGRIDAKQDYTGNLWIQIDGRGFDVGDSGWFYLRNLQLVDTSVADESVKLDYITQVKEKRIELTDGSFYTGLYSVDGINLLEGTITGESSSEKRKFTLDYDGYKLNATTGSDNAFIGEGKAYYSYSAGSTGWIDGYDAMYGVGASQQIESTGNREGVFIGVHHGFQIPNDNAYGRADIYGYNRYSDSNGTDWTDWNLLGEKVEPMALVRRDNNCNITTQEKLYFNGSSAIINIDGTNYDLASMLVNQASTLSIDKDAVYKSQLELRVEELERQNAELEERLARLEALLLGE